MSVCCISVGIRLYAKRKRAGKKIFGAELALLFLRNTLKYYEIPYKLDNRPKLYYNDIHSSIGTMC